jgi:tetraacyldisaccharide 4'-kinase
MLKYPDHHIFNSNDLKDIKKHFEKIKSSKKIILTTEKDGVRLQKFKSELYDLPIYVLPIKQHILFNEGHFFNAEILNFIEGFKK